MNKTLQTILALIIVASVTAGSAAVIRTYKNEINILNIYKSLKEIKTAIKNLDTKIDNLKEF